MEILSEIYLRCSGSDSGSYLTYTAPAHILILLAAQEVNHPFQLPAKKFTWIVVLLVLLVAVFIAIMTIIRSCLSRQVRFGINQVSFDF